MKFYVSWYPGDPWYPDYFPECNMLISITSVSQFWRLSKQKTMPMSLIVDSGGFRFASNPQEQMTPKQVFRKQIKILDRNPNEVYLCSLDYPIMNMACSDLEKDQFISKTIGYAYEFHELIKKFDENKTFSPLVIIQGFDVNSLRFCARELRAIGFDHFGLGSVIPVRDEKELVRRVQAVIDEVGFNLHIFGLSSIQIITKLKQIGNMSVDSARPAKAAMYNQILYWEKNRKLHVWESRYKNRIVIPDQGFNITCDCPICNGSLNPEIIKTGTRKQVFLRTLHNYWHISQAITA